MNRTDYKRYLESEVWLELREQARRRDGYRCRLCNSRAALHVHHRKYPDQLGTETVGDLTTLCGSCHELFHKNAVLQKPAQGPDRWMMFICLMLVLMVLFIGGAFPMLRNTLNFRHYLR